MNSAAKKGSVEEGVGFSRLMLAEFGNEGVPKVGGQGLRVPWPMSPDADIVRAVYAATRTFNRQAPPAHRKPDPIP